MDSKLLPLLRMCPGGFSLIFFPPAICQNSPTCLHLVIRKVGKSLSLHSYMLHNHNAKEFVSKCKKEMDPGDDSQHLPEGHPVTASTQKSKISQGCEDFSMRTGGDQT